MAAEIMQDVSELALRGVFNELLEMPGMRITCVQGQRLWGLDEPTCRRLLDLLVEARFLCQPSRGAYARLSDGHAPWPELRMTRACIADAGILPNRKAV
jgi:hypothetical protein